MSKKNGSKERWERSKSFKDEQRRQKADQRMIDLANVRLTLFDRKMKMLRKEAARMEAKTKMAEASWGPYYARTDDPMVQDCGWDMIGSLLEAKSGDIH